MYIVVLLGLFLSTVVSAQTPSYTYRRNSDAATTTTQPNTAPMYGSTERDGSVFGTTKPGLFVCSTAETGTSDHAIIAAVAATSHYVSSISCYNDSAVASIITFKDATTAFWSDIIGTTTLGTNRISITFPKPKKVAINAALNFDMTTTATSTICCANYLDYPNP